MKAFKKMIILAAAIVTVASLSFAQTGTGGFNADPALQKKFQAYQPVFDLTRTIDILPEMDKQKGLAITKAQAKLLLPVLKDLQSRANLKPADAEKILTNLEDKILTDPQLTWIDKKQLELQKQQAARRAQGGQTRQPGQTQGGGTAGGGTTGGQPRQVGGQRGGGIFAAITSGKPYNPFKEAGRTADSIKALIALLAKR